MNTKGARRFKKLLYWQIFNIGVIVLSVFVLISKSFGSGTFENILAIIGLSCAVAAKTFLYAELFSMCKPTVNRIQYEATCPFCDWINAEWTFEHTEAKFHFHLIEQHAEHLEEGDNAP